MMAHPKTDAEPSSLKAAVGQASMDEGDTSAWIRVQLGLLDQARVWGGCGSSCVSEDLSTGRGCWLGPLIKLEIYLR